MILNNGVYKIICVQIWVSLGQRHCEFNECFGFHAWDFLCLHDMSYSRPQLRVCNLAHEKNDRMGIQGSLMVINTRRSIDTEYALTKSTAASEFDFELPNLSERQTHVQHHSFYSVQSKLAHTGQY